MQSNIKGKLSPIYIVDKDELHGSIGGLHCIQYIELD